MNHSTKIILNSKIIRLAGIHLLLILTLTGQVLAQTRFDFSEYQKDSGIMIEAQDTNTLKIIWPASKRLKGEMILDFRSDQPLIKSLGVSENGKPAKIITSLLDPVTSLTIGERDKQKVAEGYQGMVFFEKLWQQPHQTYPVILTNRAAHIFSEANRATVSISSITASSFTGELRFTFYRNSPLIHMDTVVSTHE